MEFNLWPPASQSQIVHPASGTKTQYFFNWLNNLFDLLQGTLGKGESITVPVAKLTSGGTNGSLTFTNGVLTSSTDPT